MFLIFFFLTCSVFHFFLFPVVFFWINQVFWIFFVIFIEIKNFLLTLNSYNIKSMFKVDDIVVCSTFTMLCSYHLCLVLKYSQNLERKYHIHYVVTPQKGNPISIKQLLPNSPFIVPGNHKCAFCLHEFWIDEIYFSLNFLLC